MLRPYRRRNCLGKIRVKDRWICSRMDFYNTGGNCLLCMIDFCERYRKDEE